MSSDRQESGAERQEQARSPERHHGDWAPANVYPYQKLLDDILPQGYGRRRLILSWLDNRVGWPAFCHWIKGRRQMPQWAIVALRERLDRRHQHAMAILTEKETAATKDGRGKVIHRYF